jgi:hypothetical protein
VLVDVLVVEVVAEGLPIITDAVGLFELLPITPSPKRRAKVIAAIPKIAANTSQQG